MTVQDFDKYFRDTLDFSSFEDRSINGIQVQNTGEVKNVAFAVDCTLSTLEKIPHDTQLLVVHHGLFWGECLPIADVLYEKIQFLLKHNTALYAIHLPLDAHPTLGNNAHWSKVLGLSLPSQDLLYKNLPLGFVGEIQRSVLIEKLRLLFPKTFLQFHSEQILSIEKETLRVGLSSGGFSSSLLNPVLQMQEKPDLILTGEVDLGTFNAAKDSNLAIVPLGHYYTETLGLQALMAFMQKDFPYLNFYFIGDDKFI